MFTAFQYSPKCHIFQHNGKNGAFDSIFFLPFQQPFLFFALSVSVWPAWSIGAINSTTSPSHWSVSVLSVSIGCTLSGPEVTQMTAYPGKPVLLPCSCSEPDAKPEYVRKTVEAEPIREILGIRKSSVSDEYRSRWQVYNNEKHTGNLSLQLTTITEKDDALYRCKINGSM